jgi:hypothetical protein
MQNSGNGHLPDHCVEFAQGADQVMVWVGLIREGIVLGPYLLKGILIAGSIYKLYSIMSFNVIFEHTISTGMLCGGSKMVLPAIQAMRRCITFEHNFPES